MNINSAHNNPEQAPPLRWILALIVFTQWVAITDFMVLMPLAPNLAESLNISVQDTAWFSAGYAVASAISGLLLSSRLDQFRRLPALLTCLYLKAGLILCITMINSFDGFLIVRTLCGLLSAPVAALAMAIAIDLFPTAQRAKAMARIALGFPLAAIVGVPIGLELAYLINWKAAFLFNGMMMMLAALVWHRLWRSYNKQLTAKGDLDSNKRFHPLQTLTQQNLRRGALLTSLGIFSAFLFIPHFSAIFQYNFDYPRSGMSLLYLFGGIATIVITQAVGHVAKPNNMALLMLMTCITSIGLLIVAFISSLALPVALIFTLFMGLNGCRNVLLQIAVSVLPGANQRAGYFAVLGTVRNLSTGAAAVISGAILVETPSLQLANIESLVLLSACALMVLPWLMRNLVKPVLKLDQTGEPSQTAKSTIR
ncbi:MFS transporter [Corallincola luteus]|uniref:MFS transporter n=1 Tax=Corallincola luteus TaxID=1775177 RepID=A0ABY2ANR0_9GAMM|nr:MFS transporter [Corallincola luteus]TCI03697.1 MFS transporter [Corallincola luteus]